MIVLQKIHRTFNSAGVLFFLFIAGNSFSVSILGFVRVLHFPLSSWTWSSFSDCFYTFLHTPILTTCRLPPLSAFCWLVVTLFQPFLSSDSRTTTHENDCTAKYHHPLSTHLLKLTRYHIAFRIILHSSPPLNLSCPPFSSTSTYNLCYCTGN